VTYDLLQVDQANQLSLRDTLLTALREYHSGPRTIVVQLSLAIAGLALQLPAWENVVQNMIDLFGRNPATVPTLLEFLTILPEEINSNTRIPISVGLIRSGAYLSISLFYQDGEFRERSAVLLAANSKQVLELLSMYMQASGAFLKSCFFFSLIKSVLKA
jgi:transportin-3